LASCLTGITIRNDLLGVTSIVRVLGLTEICYDRIQDFFHSQALDLDKLAHIWRSVVLKSHPALLKVNGRFLLVGDGLKVPKAGRKMPAVKRLYQESQFNTKPNYIFGHSCQAIAILAGAMKSVFAIPLVGRIHRPNSHLYIRRSARGNV